MAAASRRVGAPQWCSQLVTNSNDGSIIGDNTSGGGGTGTGHRGCLFELFELRQGSSDKPFKALASLLCEGSSSKRTPIDFGAFRDVESIQRVYVKRRHQRLSPGGGSRVPPISLSKRQTAYNYIRRAERFQVLLSRPL